MNTSEVHPIIAQVRAKGLSDAPFVLIIVFTVKPGTEERFAEEGRKAAALTVQEKGCSAYEFYQNADDSTAFTLLEKWADEASLASHLKSEHTGAFGKAIGELVAKAPVFQYLKAI